MSFLRASWIRDQTSAGFEGGTTTPSNLLAFPRYAPSPSSGLRRSQKQYQGGKSEANQHQASINSDDFSVWRDPTLQPALRWDRWDIYTRITSSSFGLPRYMLGASTSRKSGTLDVTPHLHQAKPSPAQANSQPTGQPPLSKACQCYPMTSNERVIWTGIHGLS